jgi:hypothetical protein
MKESFNTSAGRVEVLVDEQSRTVSAYRFDAEGRPAAAAIESWNYTDLADLLIRQTGVPAWPSESAITSFAKPQPGRRSGSAWLEFTSSVKTGDT